MALTSSQSKFASDLAVLVGVILKEVPDQADVETYVALIKSEIDAVVAVPGSPSTKEIGDAALAVITDVASLVPDTTKGEKAFQHIVSIAVGFSHLFGL